VVVTTPTDPALLTIAAARRLLAGRALSAVELTTAVLDRIAARDPALNAYLRTDPEAALAQARAADRRAVAGGDEPPLLGIPVCVKDVIDVLGTHTTAGSAGWRRTPARDAGAASRLRAAGAILLPNGNTNEFAYGIDGLNPHHGDCRNPYDPARMSGGSSSGPAVATATGMALGGLGTDTTGSIRVPASLCGIAGIRPTLGLVSRAGVVPLAWSYDAVGPLGRTVEDVAILLGAVAGHDPDDPTSADRPAEDYRPGPDPDVRGLRLGVVEELVDLADAAVARGMAAAADHLAGLGAEVMPLRIGLLRHAPAIHRVVQHAESAQVHAPWFDAQRDRYAPPVRLRLDAGRRIPATAYLAAQQARRLLVEDVAGAMRGVDAMLAPAAAVAAPPRDAAAVTVRGRRVPVRDALLGCVLPISQLGCPAASVPIGDDGGLPFGMQVVGRPFAEALVLRIAAACEGRRPWADHRPPG
jgi:aspartyl-tRNA(Asn)/glutamyl-tRNA(Gln) amidotransferase subunit A